MFIIIAAFALGLGLVLYGFYLLRHRTAVPAEFNQGTLQVHGHTIHLAIADTMTARVQGLSGHTKLASDEGMLFVFPIAYKYSFWMKDMKFPLDMIWIKDSTVVSVSENVPIPAPGQSMLSLPNYYPASAVDKVLEIDAGLAGQYGIKAGDTVEITLPVNEKAQN